jgi:hypothetical protein
MCHDKIASKGEPENFSHRAENGIPSQFGSCGQNHLTQPMLVAMKMMLFSNKVILSVVITNRVQYPYKAVQMPLVKWQMRSNQTILLYESIV